ncbi:hypothetical protein JOL62DRAFT_155735 [Phyllosticta paracitricarpa]|uniref:CCT domain-containing protein n=1 Tax=Phyllosticta paracitricarpa TaxID=2016321 RepID=A0ABR1N6L7_9PEZI
MTTHRRLEGRQRGAATGHSLTAGHWVGTYTQHPNPSHLTKFSKNMNEMTTGEIKCLTQSPYKSKQLRIGDVRQLECIRSTRNPRLYCFIFLTRCASNDDRVWRADWTKYVCVLCRIKRPETRSRRWREGKKRVGGKMEPLSSSHTVGLVVWNARVSLKHKVKRVTSRRTSARRKEYSKARRKEGYLSNARVQQKRREGGFARLDVKLEREQKVETNGKGAKGEEARARSSSSGSSSRVLP